MFGGLSRPFVLSASARLSHITRDAHRRCHSTISTHASFPATLLRLNAGPVYKPFWFERQAQSKENTNVWTNCIPLSRATLMPNTFWMQQIVRLAGDNYSEDKENGLSVERPFVFTIPKGTALPTALVLLREDEAEFSLQPSQHISPNDLENMLEEFYSRNAFKQDVWEWVDDHEYHDASAPEDEMKWMAK